MVSSKLHALIGQSVNTQRSEAAHRAFLVLRQRLPRRERAQHVSKIACASKVSSTIVDMKCALFNVSFNAIVCQLCPTGMTCDGLPSSPWAMIYEDSTQVGASFWHSRPTIPKGFMTISQMFFTCFGEGTACPAAFMYAHINNTCASGGGGVACSLCPDGTQLRGEARVSCSEIIFLHISFFPNGSGCDMLRCETNIPIGCVFLFTSQCAARAWQTCSRRLWKPLLSTYPIVLDYNQSEYAHAWNSKDRIECCWQPAASATSVPFESVLLPKGIPNRLLTDWQRLGQKTLRFIAKQMPQTIGITDVAYLASGRSWTAFKAYASLLRVSDLLEALEVENEDDVDAIAEKNAVVANLRAEIAANAVVIGRTKHSL